MGGNKNQVQMSSWAMSNSTLLLASGPAKARTVACSGGFSTAGAFGGYFLMSKIYERSGDWFLSSIITAALKR